MWYDNKMENITKEGMMEGVRCSVVFLLFMSKDVFSRKWVKEEICEAIRQKKPFLVMLEKDARHGNLTLQLELSRKLLRTFNQSQRKSYLAQNQWDGNVGTT